MTEERKTDQSVETKMVIDTKEYAVSRPWTKDNRKQYRLLLNVKTGKKIYCFDNILYRKLDTFADNDGVFTGVIQKNGKYTHLVDILDQTLEAISEPNTKPEIENGNREQTKELTKKVLYSNDYTVVRAWTDNGHRQYRELVNKKTGEKLYCFLQTLYEKIDIFTVEQPKMMTCITEQKNGFEHITSILDITPQRITYSEQEQKPEQKSENTIRLKKEIACIHCSKRMIVDVILLCSSEEVKKE